MVEGYCMKCKDKREIVEAKEVTMPNGRKAMKGKCKKCGTGMYKILGNGDAKAKPAAKKEEAKPKKK